MKIAYVCYASAAKFSLIEDENNHLLAYLQQKGLAAEKVVWDDDAVDWSAYQLVVLKAPWDYFDKFAQFNEWLTRLEQLQIPLLNPVSVVRWNSDKHYLSEIEAAGLPVIPFQFIEKGEQPQLSAYFRQFNTEKLIVKPAVSGGAKNTLVLTQDNVAVVASEIEQLLQHEAFMVQPFVPEVQVEGEWSLVFFGGTYSHGLLKKVKPGDFRVQHIHGGSVHPQEAPAQLRQLAQQYVDKFAQNCLYARVDGVFMNGSFALMELELIEPFLYLSASPQSEENYYQALKLYTQRLVDPALAI